MLTGCSAALLTGCYENFFCLQVLIPIVLWWWKDLNAEVALEQSLLARVFKGWRIIATGKQAASLSDVRVPSKSASNSQTGSLGPQRLEIHTTCPTLTAS